MQRSDLVARVRVRVDANALADVRACYPGVDYAKYTNADEWIATNVAHADRAGLFDGGPRRVLDLGAGPGWFVLVAQELGHDVVGVDIAHDGVLGDIARVLGVSRSILDHRIACDRPLPDDRTWHAITAHMITFNGHHNPEGLPVWGVREWSAFLDAIGAQLVGERTLTLEMNREDDGTMFPPGVEALFVERGAVVARQYATFRGLR